MTVLRLVDNRLDLFDYDEKSPEILGGFSFGTYRRLRLENLILADESWLNGFRPQNTNSLALILRMEDGSNVSTMCLFWKES